MKVFKYKINGSPYRVVVQHSDSESVELEVNGTPYRVELEQKNKKPLSQIQRVTKSTSEPTTSTSKPAVVPKASTGSSVKSPLPGVVLEIKVSVGDTVKTGDVIMVLEAMKMENNIQADADGTVAKISVEKGASILEGAELIVIE